MCQKEKKFTRERKSVLKKAIVSPFRPDVVKLLNLNYKKTIKCQ
jgi:hypothetical protein